MLSKLILVVEDEEDTLELVNLNLSLERYNVLHAKTGEKALSILKKSTPDLVVLDLTLPGINGLEMTSRLKSDPRTRAIPIVMLAGNMCEAEVVAGLEMGADEYITKPFSPRVLLAIIKEVLKRNLNSVKNEEAATIRVHDVVLFQRKHEVLVNGKHVDLTSTEFRLLNILAKKPGWVFTRSQILDLVKGEKNIVKSRAVDTLVVGLRKKLGEAGKYIETVRSVGYRFRD
ncbi:response regulator transcription factor [Desulfobacterium sp. N47]